MDKHLVTTTLGFEGYKVTKYLGVVRGITVRSRSIVGNIGAALQTLVGGNISIYTNLCERAWQDALDLLCQHAVALGALRPRRGVKRHAASLLHQRRHPGIE